MPSVVQACSEKVGYGLPAPSVSKLVAAAADRVVRGAKPVCVFHPLLSIAAGRTTNRAELLTRQTPQLKP